MATSPMTLAYVAGPYRASTESGVVQNIRNAEEVAIALWQAGHAVICPHKNTALFGGLAPDEVWLAGDLVMMERCDFVVLVPGWEKSSGTRAEVERANELGIPVYTSEQFANREKLKRNGIVVNGDIPTRRKNAAKKDSGK